MKLDINKTNKKRKIYVLYNIKKQYLTLELIKKKEINELKQ